MHAQHMDIILIFARTRDVGLCRPCLHEKKTDMEQFGKILIVDDSELNRELLAGMLGDEYEIYQVENGKKAIDILEENREQFKLVLLDINMPVMDGYEVLSIMKRRKCYFSRNQRGKCKEGIRAWSEGLFCTSV